MVQTILWSLWQKQAIYFWLEAWGGLSSGKNKAHQHTCGLGLCPETPHLLISIYLYPLMHKFPENRTGSSGFSIIPFSCTSHYQNQSGPPHWCPCKSPLSSLQWGSTAPAQRCKKSRRAFTLCSVRLQEDEGGKKPVPTFPQFAASLYCGWWVWGEGRNRASILKSFYLNPSSPRPRDIQAPICSMWVSQRKIKKLTHLPFHLGRMTCYCENRNAMQVLRAGMAGQGGSHHRFSCCHGNLKT